VDLLTRAPAHLLAGAQLDVDLRQLPDKPRRSGVGRCAEDDLDAVFVGGIEHGGEPLEIELAVVGFPCGPDRLANADDGEARLLHEAHVFVEAGRGLVLVVVGGAEQHGFVEVRHGGPFVVERGGHPLTAPAVSPSSSCLRSRMNTRMVGMEASTAPASTRSYERFSEANRMFSPRGSVY